MLLGCSGSNDNHSSPSQTGAAGSHAASGSGSGGATSTSSSGASSLGGAFNSGIATSGTAGAVSFGSAGTIGSAGSAAAGLSGTGLGGSGGSHASNGGAGGVSASASAGMSAGMSAGAGGRGPAPTFTKIYDTIITPNCGGAACHLKPPTPFGYDFSSRSAASESWRGDVFPNDADDSPMFQVLNFAIMPKDKPALSVEQLFMVYDWINAGALDN
jgi:hypothetical protein